MDVSKDLQKPAGFHVIPPETQEVESIINLGYKFIAVSLDTLFLGSLCKKIIKDLR